MPRFSPESSQFHLHFSLENPAEAQTILERLDEYPELRSLIISTLFSADAESQDQGLKLLVILQSLPANAEEFLNQIVPENTSFGIERFEPIHLTHTAEQRLEEQQILDVIESHPDWSLNRAYFEIYGKVLEQIVFDIDGETIQKRYNNSISAWYYLLLRALTTKERREGTALTRLPHISIEMVFNQLTIMDLLNQRNVGVTKVIQLFQKMHWFDQTMES